jgi:hypothetical protein
MAFRRHHEKPQQTLVRYGRLRQPCKSKTILPTKEEDRSMSQRKRYLPKRQKPESASKLSHLSFTGQLIDAACDFAASLGASEIEASPRISPERESSPLTLFMGTEGSFARAGFRVLAEPTPIRRIMRKRVASRIANSQ